MLSRITMTVTLCRLFVYIELEEIRPARQFRSLNPPGNSRDLNLKVLLLWIVRLMTLRQRCKRKRVEVTEEGIKTVINFLKDKIPGLKVEVMNVDVTEDIVEDDSLNQFIHGEENEETDENSDDESVDFNELVTNISSIGDNGDSVDENISKVKVFVGEVLHNNDDASSKDGFTRLPAEISDMKKNSFLLHVPGVGGSEDNIMSTVKVAAVVDEGASDLMPSGVAKSFMRSVNVSSEIALDVREIVKYAVSQAQKRNGLSEYTTFSRVATSKGNLDPFEGLYIGAFSSYGSEVVQSRRKFGHWNNESELNKSSDMEFFEYVEAVKLNGDLNVPAGEVAF